MINSRREENDAAEAAALAPRSNGWEWPSGEQVAQFYEDDAFLVSQVADAAAEALERGEAVLVIATGTHCDAIADAVGRHGLELGPVRKSGQYRSVDAAAALARFTERGQMNGRRFNEHIGGLVRRACAEWSAVRVFDEMDALLWERDEAGAAERLEALWNELGRTCRFALLSAYPMRAFRRVGDAEPFEHIWRSHASVIPAESYQRKMSEKERLRSVARLQQRASALAVEIEERRLAEAWARREHAKLDLAAATAQLGLWELDVVAHTLTVSPECRAHFGFALGEPLDLARLLAVVHEGDRARVQNALERTLEEGAPFAAEFRVVHPAGETRWISAAARLVIEDGAHALGVTRDATDRKRASETLERAVALRTAELRESLLELESFSYSVSHDLRAPLRVMEGHAAAILEDHGSRLDRDVVDSLERIRGAARRMDQLVRDVLAYSKLAQGQFEIRPVALERVLDDVLAQQSGAQRRAITVDRPLNSVMGNETCLGQCLGNLVANALKFTPPGVPPRVRVRSELDGELVKISVADQGLGIHPEHHDRIFQMFARLHTDIRYEGTGMGLAIAKKAVSRMGGKIGFASQVGRGSTFWFTLPRSPAQPS